jgi:hypothetical protein
MVGGVVIGVSRRDDVTHVHVANCCHYPRHKNVECPNPDTCCVYTDEKVCGTLVPVHINLGDSFWWQGGKCYWTPGGNKGKRCGVDYDIPLRKIGYSH